MAAGDLDERCGLCNVLRYFDCNAESNGGAEYVCTDCTRTLSGRRRANHQELQRFLADPEEIYRLEQRVKDLELIVSEFARAAV